MHAPAARPKYVAGKCSRNGMKVGVRCCFVVSRLPVKFHRVWSLFDAPTDNYSGSIPGLIVGRFRSLEIVPGYISSLSSQTNPLSTAYLGPCLPLFAQCTGPPLARFRKLSRTRPGQSSPLCPDHPQRSTKRLRFVNWTSLCIFLYLSILIGGTD